MQGFLKQLDQIARGQRRCALLTATAWAVCLAIGAATLLIAIDWVGRFTDPGLRWLFSGVLIGTVVAAVIKGRTYIQGIQASRLSVAQKVEQLHPDLGSRLASAVEFADQESDDPGAGSAELRRAVVLEAATQSEGVDFESAIDRQPLRRATHAVLAAGVPAVLFALLAWPTYSLGLQRLAAPWADLDWPRRNVLELVDPVESLAAGSQFEATAIDRVGRLPEDIRIEYHFAQSEESPERTETQAMRLVGDQAVATRDEVTEPFSYRVVGGDDQTMAWVYLEIHDPPRVTSIELQTTPPEYTGLRVTTQPGGSLRVIEGTQINLRAESNETLTAASIERTGKEPIEAQLQADNQGNASRLLTIAKDAWVAGLAEENKTSRGEYRIVLKNERGLVGQEERAPYRVVPDTSPVVAWTGTTADQFVTNRAVVSISAGIEDNLAVASAELRWQAFALQTEEGPVEPIESAMPLYEGPADPPSRDSLEVADRITIEQPWDLATLELSPGVRLDLVVAASDYKPTEGLVELPRRVFIVTDEEFEQRFADKQSQLLAEVQRALEIQREAQESATELRADLQQADKIDRAVLDRLTSLTYSQRQANDAVDDPQSGAAALAERLAEELRSNRLDRPELLEQLENVGGGLNRLARTTMPDAARAAAAARRTADSSAAPNEAAAQLGEAQQYQSEAVEQLEQIAKQLTGWSDYQRFAREVAQLQAKQNELAATAAAEAAKAHDDPLGDSRQRAAREKLVAEQAETRRRFESLRQAMQELLDSAQEDAQSAAEAVSDALDEAAESDISGSMRDASRELALGRMGAATARQQRAAEGLDKMLEALRQRASSDPEELIERLREAQKELAQMEQEAAEMQNQANSSDQAQELSRQADRMSRQLERLTASQAAGSTQQASQSLGQGGESGQSPDQQQMAQAEQSLQEAQEQVEQRIEELEDESTQRALDRLKAKMPEFIARQQQLLDSTLELEQQSLQRIAEQRNQIRRAAQGLAGDQEMLQLEISKAAEEVASRAIFELALRGTEEEMGRAAEGLDAMRLGRSTQRSEFAALQRLKHIEEVLQENQDLQEQQEQGGGGGGGGGGGEQPPSPIDVAELKMLRLMQLDLLSRTDAYEADAVEARKTQKEPTRRWIEYAESLSEEQTRLAELALEMARRDNDPDAAQKDQDNDPQDNPE